VHGGRHYSGPVLIDVFSSASAINATLFATARLGVRVANDGELPAVLAHRNASNMPDRAVVLLGIGGATLAAIGTLSTLVEAASLAFLFTFVTVNGVAAFEETPHRWVAWTGLVLGNAALISLMIRMALTNVPPLIAICAVAVLAVAGRFARRYATAGGSRRSPS